MQALEVPDGLAGMPPGPELGALLATIDRSGLGGADVVVLMRARARQVAFEQGQLLADIVEVSTCETMAVDLARTSCSGEYAAEEVAAALTWTPGVAGVLLGVGWCAWRDHPALGALMLAGELDLPRMKVIADMLEWLEPDTAAKVVARILPRVARLTTGRLKAALAKLAISIDPQAARRRYEKGVGEREVRHGLFPDGTAKLGGYALPADRASAAADRIWGLAAGLKQRGDERDLDQIRADIFLNLLQGLPMSTALHPDTSGAGAGLAGPGGAGASASGPSGAGTGGATGGGVGTGGAGDGHAGPNIGPDGKATGRGGVELTVPLATLMALSEQPGQLGVWGPVIADIARQIAQQQRDTPWRFSVTDPDGRVIAQGRTSRRPTAPDAAFVRARDRTCRFPGCRRPARHADLDHTKDWQHGGPTIPENLGVLCRRHHRLKHNGRWKLTQRPGGEFTWTSPLGFIYIVEPDPVEDPEEQEHDDP